MSSSWLLKSCPACLVRLTKMVLEMGSKWLYNCCFQGLFNIARCILVQFPSSVFFQSVLLASMRYS